MAHLSHVGIQLFLKRGFDETTIDDIAAAAGIGRRTFFRYFASKNDLPWGDFDRLVASMRAHLASDNSEDSLGAVLSRAIIEFNRFPPQELVHHKQRMQLLLNVPELVAHSTLRYSSWRQVIAEYAAIRLGTQPGELRPQLIAWAMLAAAMTAYEQWLDRDESDLSDLLRESLAGLAPIFQADT